MYFNFVAIPPRICLSALFSSSITLTSFASFGFIFTRRSETSLCTVLLLTPNFLAAPLTVSFESIIYDFNFILSILLKFLISRLFVSSQYHF